jgi:hypothetical protein
MPLKEQRPWYENALLLAVAGSIIVFIGQLAGTVIPIMYGPQDMSDFSISLNPISVLVQSSMSHAQVINISVEDLHKHLRPYKFGVLLKALDVPAGVIIWFEPHEIRPGESSKMVILIPLNTSSMKSENHIIIQAVGGDGKKRNTTFYLYTQDLVKNMKELSMYDLEYNIINRKREIILATPKL